MRAYTSLSLLIVAVCMAVCVSAQCDTTIDPSSNFLNVIKNYLLTATPGDTICLNPGLFTGCNATGLEPGMDINIRGSGVGVTTVDCEGVGQFLYLSSAETVTLSDMTFTRGYAYEGALVDLETSGSQIHLTNMIVSHCVAETDGGALHGRISTILSAKNVTFYNNTAATKDGGAILGYEVNVTDCDFVGNTARSGGAIYQFYAYFHVVNTNFHGNNAVGTHAGAVFSSYSTVRVDGAHFKGNSAASLGGAMRLYNAYDVVMATVHYENNTALSNGGALNTFSVDAFTCADCNFTENYSGNHGGGVYVESAPGVFDFDGVVLRGNTAVGSGGGVYAFDGSTMVVANAVVEDNVANSGGGVYSTSCAVLDFTNTGTFSSNTPDDSVCAGGCVSNAGAATCTCGCGSTTTSSSGTTTPGPTSTTSASSVTNTATTTTTTNTNTQTTTTTTTTPTPTTTSSPGVTTSTIDDGTKPDKQGKKKKNGAIGVRPESVVVAVVACVVVFVGWGA